MADQTGYLQDSQEFIGFWLWLRKKTKIRFKLVGWIALLAPTLGITYYTLAIVALSSGEHLPFHLRQPTADQAFHFSYLLQIGVVFLILVLHTRFTDLAHAKDTEIGTHGQEQISKWWGIALISFLLLYMLLFARSFHIQNQFIDSVLGLCCNLFNNLSTIAFLMCFSVMESPSEPARERSSGLILLWGGCLLMLLFVEAIFRFGHPDLVKNWNTDWFDVLTGINAGIALAMFCGRISSPLIEPPLPVIGLLYFYAVVQASFGFWPRHPGIALVMANVGLLLKCLLSLVIAWLLTTWHLIFYMETVQQARFDLNNARGAFLTGNPFHLLPVSPAGPIALGSPDHLIDGTRQKETASACAPEKGSVATPKG